MLLAGLLDEPDQVSHRYREQCQYTPGIGDVVTSAMRGAVAACRGQLNTAARWFRQSLVGGADTGLATFTLLVDLPGVLGMAGDASLARQALEELSAAHDQRFVYLAPELLLTRAWVAFLLPAARRETMTSGTSTALEEQIEVAAPAAEAFDAVADVHRMARRSPECFATLVLRKRNGRPARFIGFNRHGMHVWFSSCHVRVADPGREFMFDVFALGFPVARWSYRFEPAAGGTRVTEYWFDKRTTGARVLGRIFIGKHNNNRVEINKDGMWESLRLLKSELESGR